MDIWAARELMPSMLGSSAKLILYELPIFCMAFLLGLLQLFVFNFPAVCNQNSMIQLCTSITQGHGEGVCFVARRVLEIGGENHIRELPRTLLLTPERSIIRGVIEESILYMDIYLIRLFIYENCGPSCTTAWSVG